MNFMFECQKLRSLVRYFFLPREHKTHIFELTCNVFLLYRHSDDGVFDDFPKISDHFPKISEGSRKRVRKSHERCRTFSEISEEFRPKIAEDFRGRPADVSIIHQRTKEQFVYVIGPHAVQFGNNWMENIAKTAKIGRGRRPSTIWLSEGFFESSYF